MVDGQQGGEPLVSVIVPVYNCAPYLRRCLDSIVAQTYDAWELICVDDGSTDSSRDGLRPYEERLGDRMRVLEQQNAGPARARNRGIDLARGRYLLFVDADDFIDERLMELAVARAEELEADIVAWDVWFYNDRHQRLQHPPDGILHFAPFDADGVQPFSWEKSPDDILLSFQNWPWNKLFRASFVREGGFRFKEDLMRTEDASFVCAALVKARRIGTLGERLSCYRIMRPGSAMATKDAHALDFYRAILDFKGFLEREGLFDPLRRSYISWALSSVVYNLNTLASYESFCVVFERLACGGLGELGLAGCARDELSDPALHDRLREIEEGTAGRYAFERTRILDLAREDAAAVCDFTSMDARSTEARLNSELETARAERARAEARAAERIAALEGELARTRAEFDAVMNAAEQKVGQVVCALPRAVQRRVLARKGK